MGNTFSENSDLIFLGKDLKILKKQILKIKQQFFLVFKIAHQLKMILI
jgi:hypothetical protein